MEHVPSELPKVSSRCLWHVGETSEAFQQDH